MAAPCYLYYVPNVNKQTSIYQKCSSWDEYIELYFTTRKRCNGRSASNKLIITPCVG